MATIDYKLDDTLDYEFENGDFKLSSGDQADQQSSCIIINISKGSLKKYPLCGVGIMKYLGSSGKQLEIKRELRLQHEADGFRINEIQVKNGQEFNLDIEKK